MTPTPARATNPPPRPPSAAPRRWGQGATRDEQIAARRHRPRPRTPLTDAERAVLDQLLGEPVGADGRRP